MLEDEKYGITGDIHGNDVAFEEVVHDMEKHGITTDHIIVLGDIIDYNAHSNRCARLAAESGIRAVAGNHDIRIVGDRGEALPSDEHIQAYGLMGPWNLVAEICREYTEQTLSEDAAKYIANRPLMERFDHSVATHAGLLPGWNYFAYDNEPGFQDIVHANMLLMMWLRQQPGNEGVNVCFVAHSHRPGHVKENHFVPAYEGMELDVGDRNKIHTVDAGSAGQPRDGDKRASWLEYNATAGKIIFRRTAYDIDRIAAANMAAGLPAFVSARLYQGR